MLLSNVFEESRDQDGRRRGNEGDPERPGKRRLFGQGHLRDLLHVEEGHFRLVDDSPAHCGRCDGVRLAVEDSRVQFFFQLLDHQA